jgi:hypothetical protein
MDKPYAGKAADSAGWAHQVIPKHSNLPFELDEMEFMVLTEAGPPCFLEVRKQVLEKFRRTIGWRLMYRTNTAGHQWRYRCIRTPVARIGARSIRSARPN